MRRKRGLRFMTQAPISGDQDQPMHPGGRHDELIGGVAGRKCREAHCVGDDFWSEREDVHVAGDGVVEPCFEIAVEGQLAELRLLASHSLMALSPNVSLA